MQVATTRKRIAPSSSVQKKTKSTATATKKFGGSLNSQGLTANAARVKVPYRNLGPFPIQLQNTIRYTDFVFLNTTAGSGLAEYLFSANGIYDPNITGTGHQPMYFDQLMAIYDHWTVVTSKITWTLVNHFSSPVNWAVYLDDDTITGVSSMTQACEKSGARSGVWNPHITKPHPISSYYSAFKTFGGTILSNDQLQGTVSANLTEGQSYCLYIQDVNGEAHAYYFKVDIEYTVVWTELKTVVSS